MRLKRSFEEVCLKYTRSTRYKIRNCSVSFAKIRGRSFIPVPGTCTNHLITGCFLMYPCGTRATFMCLHLFQLSNLFLPAILSMFEYSTNLFKIYQRSTRFIYNMCVPRIGWCVPGVRCQLVHTCVYTCTTHACAHLLSTLCTTVNRLSMGGQ